MLAKCIATRTIYSFLIWNERWIERMCVLALKATLRILCLIYCRTIWWYISRHWVERKWILAFKAIWEMWLVSGHREIVCLKGLDWDIQRMNVLSLEAVRKARYITIQCWLSWDWWPSAWLACGSPACNSASRRRWASLAMLASFIPSRSPFPNILESAGFVRWWIGGAEVEE